VSAARSRPAGRARNWSWNRLTDRAARDLVDASRVECGDLVLDLGAGDGAITHHLVRSGARVIAFELHPERAAHLRDRFGAEVKVVRADVRDLRLPTRPFSVVANPPFAGVNAVLVRLTHHGSRLERADLLVPRSVARSWITRWERRRTPWSATVERVVPRAAFTPRPRIDVVHLSIRRRVGA
jgi:23S rRNA (adenine-N6)-dimethyltransferase